MYIFIGLDGTSGPTYWGVRTVSNRLPWLHKPVHHLNASNTICGIEPLSQLYARRYSFILYRVRRVTDSNPHSCNTFTVFKTANYSFRTLLIVTSQGLEPQLFGPKPNVLTITLRGNNTGFLLFQVNNDLSSFVFTPHQRSKLNPLSR